MEFTGRLSFLTGLGILGVIGMLTAFPCPEKSCGHDVMKPYLAQAKEQKARKRQTVDVSCLFLLLSMVQRRLFFRQDFFTTNDEQI